MTLEELSRVPQAMMFQSYWNQVEQYVSGHTDAQFSHGICPACFEREMKRIDETSA
jgi:hypothetical protein